MGDNQVTLYGESSPWVSLGPVAQVAVAYFPLRNTAHEPLFTANGRAEGIGMIIDLSTKGITKGPPLHKLGQRTLPQGSIKFDAVKLSKDYIIAGPDQYEASMLAALIEGNQTMAVVWVGAGRAAYEHTRDGEPNSKARGFGHEVELAKAKRRHQLFKMGILKSRTAKTTAHHLVELQRRDLVGAGEELSREFAKPYAAAPDAGKIKGIYARAIQRPSGKFAVVERAKDFTLVPWRDVLERQRGKAVSGLIRGKSISWSFGKSRGVT